MTTNPRTLRLVTKLAAQHPEFRESVKPGWWLKNPICPKCGGRDSETTARAECWTCINIECGYKFVNEGAEWNYVAYPPDLTHRDHLADLFDVCDAIWLSTQCFHKKILTVNNEFHYRARVMRSDFNVYQADGPTRQLALLAAAERTLGLEPWSEATR